MHWLIHIGKYLSGLLALTPLLTGKNLGKAYIFGDFDAFAQENIGAQLFFGDAG